MKLGIVTDSLAHLKFEEMLKTVSDLGYETIEIGCGNWSSAPHLDLDGLLNSKEKRESYLHTIEKYGMKIDALNCSGNQLAPNKQGEEHRRVIEKTFQLAELLNVKTIVMMSGLPGGNPNDTTPNWITTSWPPENKEILDWQWNEVAFPYWEKTVTLAKEHGIEKVAIENHGSQLIYNTETLMKLRNQAGNMIGMNLDPSHMFWMGADPIIAARSLGDAIHHVHAKDVRFEKGIYEKDGLLDTKTVDRFTERSWNFVAIGYGNPSLWWKEFFSAIRMSGYKGSISLELEDHTIDTMAALHHSTNILKDTIGRNFN
ncbi:MULTISPECIES: sugar phosphate isomerase/epimerase family protein [Bacillaceae]|uniref:Xylose isomerase-like TIM barrel domain-containing protein n=1 Tax=Oceanobacillus caeni TaxID=405946 RepID=A0ABR5MMP0_9BACI|nr:MULTISPECIES: sugar phosphate isomerase/epimerase [Bacillaceae]KPH77890.1 hypothetical protein AFL42_02765 [Oceanobacillus caeni]MBU8789357.1 sugar phosphate isomerase/epimerase [Oceanobacillus caeni]MED4474010.1 sugar phosphate isomerase/epimerase [Oceanobacillus caeni]